ncbi:MAG: hypothetical protein GEU88_02810 [Solirubrobacterales bacterium]|nr:hypothetical protein [Solirubrobacterales bacterium]
MSEPTIVCVLGMHRSGTSLVSRVLNVLGVDLGPEEHLMRPGLSNPAGYWESRPIKEINDEILRRLGGSWAKPPELAPGWESRRELNEVRRQARALIESDFSSADLWGFKDPRASLTAPFWQRMLAPMRYVVCVRNPVDVAASLEAREEERVPFDEGMWLWLTYVRAALAHTAGHPRQLVFYEDLMADPEPVVGRLARFIGTDRSDTAELEGRMAIRVARSEGLWHHRTAVPNVVDAGRLPFPVKALYLALRLSTSGGESIGGEVLDLLAAYAAGAGRHIAELEARRGELAKARDRSRSLQTEFEKARDRSRGLQAELDESRAQLRGLREQSRSLKRERAALGRRLAEREDELDADRAELRKQLDADRAELERLREESPSTEGGGGTPSAGGQRDAPGPGPDNGYGRLVAEVRARAREAIPSGATVLVAGKGDDALLELDGCSACHFPVAADGSYLGHHPAGDTAVIAQLEALRARGADHLLLPATTLWWLDHYHGLRRHLQDRYVTLLEDDDCAIYRLRAGDRRPAGPIATLRRAVACVRMRSGRDPSILDWRTELGIADQLPEMPVFVPPGEEPVLPYLDGTVDIVVLASADVAQIGEARRVAASAVIRVDPSSPEEAELEWSAGAPSGWGEDVSVTLIPDADAPWEPTVSAFAETLNDGFAGELSVIGEAAELGRASEQAAADGVGVRLIEAPAGASLARRARTAAEAGDPRVQVLVTAPAVPLPDWLPPILALFSGDRDAGVVGTRTLSRDGALEEAGGILAADGARRRRGEGEHDPDRPEYGFVRRVDFCSPPLIATRRDLFERLAGLDEQRAAPADALVDFSLRAGRSGAPVYYQPQARVVAIGEESR